MTLNHRFTMAGVLLLVVLGAVGCVEPGKVTGGGSVLSFSGSGVAHFGFNAQNCDQGEPKGRFNYHDKNAEGFQLKKGVKINGPVTGGGLCCDRVATPELCLDDPTQLFCLPPDQLGVDRGYEYVDGTTDVQGWCFYGEYQANFEYRSTNPEYPVGGIGTACVRDNGEGMDSDFSDTVFIVLHDGDYAGYKNEGSVFGNVQGHACDE